jgi:hypothetical protein
MQGMEHIAPQYPAPSARCAIDWSLQRRSNGAFAHPHRYQGGTGRSQRGGTACAYADSGCLPGQVGSHDG